jgi:Ion transport protein
LILKIFGYGIKTYSRNLFNDFNAVISILGIVELWMKGSSGSALAAFRVGRLFRAFRVLRVTRLLCSLRYMKIIVEVISNSLSDFFYTALLLFLFIFIFPLFGMQVFGGHLVSGETSSRASFDSLYSAFLAVFQILSLQNWHEILDLLMQSDVNKLIGLAYLIVWIVIGN